MIRFFVNAVGTLLLALALVFAVGDIARSIAQDAVRITAMGDAMASIGLPFGPGAETSSVTADLIVLVSSWPAAPVLAVFAFLVFLLARPREARARRLAR
ncbi:MULTISPECIES: hypothetical protein [unclassified Aureimonas]|uniref:hypothetical protein n=1 Tax=unclassified Aureimonas TaxID=2615206 RepID=UPI000701F0F2|nr:MULTISPECIES: hypothetical protein [unclassified Aureimonas]KQT53843.1 hypothetical protein ASG62_11395 [Aureimonas sp. Leaf427]KQT71716.1 hypothetical protein ASG54_19765 [Aureimonas sp. Leaf460]